VTFFFALHLYCKIRYLITSAYFLLFYFLPNMSFSKAQAFSATTTSPWTQNFLHLRPIPRHWVRRRTVHDPYLKAVAPQQRIKYWNIVPGDRVRIRGDSEGTIQEVLSINRLTNRVFLKGVLDVSCSVLFNAPYNNTSRIASRTKQISSKKQKRPLF